MSGRLLLMLLVKGMGLEPAEACLLAMNTSCRHVGFTTGGWGRGGGHHANMGLSRGKGGVAGELSQGRPIGT